MRADQIGAKGEARFQELCEDAGLVCNKSSRDMTGWDYIVEFAFPHDSKSPLDSAKSLPIVRYYRDEHRLRRA